MGSRPGWVASASRRPARCEDESCERRQARRVPWGRSARSWGRPTRASTPRARCTWTMQTGQLSRRASGGFYRARVRGLRRISLEVDDLLEPAPPPVDLLARRRLEPAQREIADRVT